jgi:hypothetical protein
MTSTRVFIYGSCVSRDTFEHLDPEQFELVQYVARQSVLSATTRPVELMAPPSAASRFQQRMLDGDFRSSLRPLLQQYANEVDVLLVDLTDERLGVYLLPDGTVVTRSVELIESGAEQSLPQGTRYVQFGTQQHFEYWSGAIRALGDTIRQAMPHASVALLNVPWAEWSESGAPTPDSFGVTAAQANPVFASYVEAAREALGAHVVSLDPADVVSGPHHPWGDAPFHYAERVYLDIVRRLTGSEGRVVWGEPVAAGPEPANVSTASGPVVGSGPVGPLKGGPNLVLAGTQRGGVEWLKKRLALLPEFFVAPDTASNFFNRPDRFGDPAKVTEYLDAFEAANGAPWRAEVSPNYFWHSDSSPYSTDTGPHDAATAFAELAAPEARVLLSLRNPVERAVSAYWIHFSVAKFDLPSSIFTVPPRLGTLDLGFYRRHYDRWASAVDANRISVVLYDDLVEDPARYLAHVLTSLGARSTVDQVPAAELVPPTDHAPWLKPFKKRHPVSALEIAALVTLYEKDIRFTEEVTQRDLSAWRDVDKIVETLSK